MIPRGVLDRAGHLDHLRHKFLDRTRVQKGNVARLRTWMLAMSARLPPSASAPGNSAEHIAAAAPHVRQFSSQTLQTLQNPQF